MSSMGQHHRQPPVCDAHRALLEVKGDVSPCKFTRTDKSGAQIHPKTDKLAAASGRGFGAAVQHACFFEGLFILSPAVLLLELFISSSLSWSDGATSGASPPMSPVCPWDFCRAHAPFGVAQLPPWQLYIILYSFFFSRFCISSSSVSAANASRQSSTRP